jgi:two-component system, OmpR family, response regulator CpxR
MEARQSQANLILVVEDHKELRESLMEILEEEGCTAVGAADGQEALDYLRTHSLPCLILLDLMMPGLNGWEFCAQKEQDPALAAIPVVVLSGVGRLEQKAAALRAVGWLEKPIHIPLLLELIRRYCY